MRIPPDQTTHGMSRTKPYAAWQQMKERCLNSKSKSYRYYGGRGITVCKSWLNSFENFYKDMGDPPSQKHSLDRIDNNKGYGKENCRWATIKQQNKNQTKTVFLTNGGRTLPISDWAREIGLSLQTLHSRRRLGYPVEEILKPKKYDRYK